MNKSIRSLSEHCPSCGARPCELCTGMAECRIDMQDPRISEFESTVDGLRHAIDDCNVTLANVEAERNEALVEVERLQSRQQELLQVIVRLTNETPFPDEIKGWTAQRAKLISEVGTQRSRCVELESQLAAASAELDKANQSVAKMATEADERSGSGPLIPPRKEWDAESCDFGDTSESDSCESSDYVDGWNDALDAVQGCTPIQRADQEIKALRSTLMEQSQRLADLEPQIAALSAQLDQARQDGTALEIRMIDLEGALGESLDHLGMAVDLALEGHVLDSYEAAMERSWIEDGRELLGAIPDAASGLAANSSSHSMPRETSASIDAWQAAVRDARQAKIFERAKAAFSVEQSTSLPQRGLRLLEESIEAFQSVGGDPVQAHRLIDFVFSRPVGALHQELGGVGVCVLTLAAAAGLSADEEEQREVARVLAKPIEELRRRNDAKNAAGFLVCGLSGQHVEEGGDQ